MTVKTFYDVIKDFYFIQIVRLTFLFFSRKRDCCLKCFSLEKKYVNINSITCASLSPLRFSTETWMTSFSLSSLSSDCDFDILLNRQAYLLFEPKNILFCCVTNRSWRGHDEPLATHPPFQLSHWCHRRYAVTEGVCVCVCLQDLKWRIRVMLGER